VESEVKDGGGWSRWSAIHAHHCEGGDCTHVAALHQVTDTYFHTYFSYKAGLIVADSNLSPFEAAKRNDSEVSSCDLQHWSDAVFIQWKSWDFELEIRNLRYVLRFTINNDHTLAVINQILDAHRPLGKGCPSWPGITIDVDSEDGKALLGTPNGSGVAWLLIQHKANSQVGHKSVKKVTLLWPDFLDDYEATARKEVGLSASLLFWIEDAVVV
jgi:hypothetical protein